MIQKFLAKASHFVEKNPKYHFFKPLVSALDTFLFEVSDPTFRAPHIRDSVDIKRWMMLVVFALFPCVFVAIWNTGLQAVVYSSKDPSLMKEYFFASQSFGGYCSFCFSEGRFLDFLWEGLYLFLPIMLISYLVGGFWEALFACIRKHEIAEGFLVTGLLYPLILPPTLPLWMVALGVSLGVIISKELFGGTGMNILNPALTCRCFLYFAFPAYMTGQIWIGENPNLISQNLLKVNQELHLSGVDAYAQPSFLGVFNINREIKRIHIDAISKYRLNKPVDTAHLIEKQFNIWNKEASTFDKIPTKDLEKFLTDPISVGGLGLLPNYFPDAEKFAEIKYGQGIFSDGNLFWGNIFGSMGEVSKIAILLGALLLIITGIGSWRTMLSVSIGVIFTAGCFQLGSIFLGNSAWNPAIFDFPIYKHFLVGGLLFGLVFMATDPVSSPAMNSSKWIYGFLIGSLVVLVRVFNPAYPEGVMLAILFANVFAPLIDYYAVRLYRGKNKIIVER